jgi:hypothetical protein
MNATEVLYEAREHGAVFTTYDEGRVSISAPLPLPVSLVAALKERKSEIVLLLDREPDYAGTGCTCGESIGGTGSKRCGVCALPLICPHCSRCRGCRRALMSSPRSWSPRPRQW